MRKKSYEISPWKDMFKCCTFQIIQNNKLINKEIIFCCSCYYDLLQPTGTLLQRDGTGSILLINYKVQNYKEQENQQRIFNFNGNYQVKFPTLSPHMQCHKIY